MKQQIPVVVALIVLVILPKRAMAWKARDATASWLTVTACEQGMVRSRGALILKLSSGLCVYMYIYIQYIYI